MKIHKSFRFEAAHFLPHVPSSHKCRRTHGHGYCVEVWVEGDIARNGFVDGLDFAEIKAHWRSAVHDRLDHRLLNDVEGLDNPTAEVLAQWIFDELASRLQGLCRVRVWETPDSSAEVER